MSNLGWQFYKGYFRDINWNNIDETAISKKVDDIINSPITIEASEPLGNIHFKASTTYPGLILGSGYLHELPSIKGQAILGFDFDYTSGLPIIRGSSIKGVLRSAFKHQDYIKDLLSKQKIEVKKLELEIFGQDNDSNQVLQGKDIFFDATIIHGDRILEDDYLAPHGDNPLKNPTPLRFIKVAPNITFRFNFQLSDGIISKKEKALLFGQILYDLGVGAKTNVGYGKFNDRLTKDRLEDQLKKNEKEEQEKKDAKEKIIEDEKNAKKLASMSPIDALKEQIKSLSDNKDIYDLLVEKKIKDKDLEKFVLAQIGAKPIRNRPARRRWAIKIYEFFGL